MAAEFGAGIRASSCQMHTNRRGPRPQTLRVTVVDFSACCWAINLVRVCENEVSKATRRETKHHMIVALGSIIIYARDM